MKNLSIFLLLVVTVPIVFLVGCATVEEVQLTSVEKNLEAEVIKENWMEIYMFGGKVGYAHYYVKESRNGYEIVNEGVMKTKRSGVEIESRQISRAYVDEDFSPKYFIYRELVGRQEKLVEGGIQGNELRVRASLADTFIEKTFDIDKEIFLESSVGEVVTRKGLAVGNCYRFKVFDERFLEILEETFDIERKERIEFEGREREAYRVKRMHSGLKGMTITEWLDLEGNMLKYEVKELGLSMVRVKKEEAQRWDSIIDLGQTGHIRSNVEISNLDRISQMRIRLSIEEGDIAQFLASDRRQRIELQDEDGVILNIRKIKFEDYESLNLPLKDERYRKFLEPTLYAQSENKEISQKAREIIEGEENAWRASKRLSDWVHKNLRMGQIETPFASAEEVLESREGDCSEHATLFVALARAAGIPARVCDGIVYIGEAFDYHMWAEVYVGEWIAIDPTRGQSEVDVTHIKFGDAVLDSASLIRLSLNMARTINNLDLKILSYTVDSKEIRVIE